MIKNKNYKKWLLISLGGSSLLGSAVASVTVSEISQTVASKKSDMKASNNIESQIIYQKRQPYELSYDGFVSMMLDAKNFFPEITIPQTEDVRTKNWFESNKQKAFEQMSYINAKMNQRGIGDFFSGLFKTVVSGLTTAITFGQVKETIDLAKEGANLLQRDPNGPDAPGSANAKFVGECMINIGSNFVKIPVVGEAVNTLSTLVGLATTKC